MTHEKSDEITVDALRTLVHGFYGRVRDDAELGPIFERVVGRSPGGWPPHLEKMTAFWSAMMLQVRGFQGNPREAHGRVADIEPRHFARWLFLFQLEANRVFAPGPAGGDRRRRAAGRRSVEAGPVRRAALSPPHGPAVRRAGYSIDKEVR